MTEQLDQLSNEKIWELVLAYAAEKGIYFSHKKFEFGDITFERITTPTSHYVKATATQDDCYLFSLGRRTLYNIDETKEHLQAVSSEGLHLGVLLATVPMPAFSAWCQPRLGIS